MKFNIYKLFGRERNFYFYMQTLHEEYKGNWAECADISIGLYFYVIKIKIFEFMFGQSWRM